MIINISINLSRALLYNEDTKLELVAFILNKNNVCKNQNCVIENGIWA